jgi:dTDP-4-dehydrorhamnose 3,5-epimerase-like enzyme
MTARPTIRDCVLLDLPKHIDPRGNLSVVEGSRHVPFDIRRIFYIYDVPTGESRGAHAHRTLQQFLVCLSGTFEVAVDDGRERARIPLNRPWKGLLVPPMIWAAEENFSPGTVCLVLTSDFYREEDYIRDYAEFQRLARD